MIGPKLWNVLYVDVLTSELPEEVTLVGFVDDLAMTAIAKTKIILASLMVRELQRIANIMKLKLAPEK